MQSDHAASPAAAVSSAQHGTENLGSAFISVLPSLAWVVLVIAVLYYFRRQILRIAEALVQRLESGALVKFGTVELSEIRVSSDPRDGIASTVRSFVDESRNEARQRIYGDHSRIFLAHRLFPSHEPDQTYDIWIYLVTHNSNLNDVHYVEYYFGEHWSNQVFISYDRGKRFGVLASAYGSGFLCMARVHFHSRGVVDTWRYIDFEQGGRGKE